MVTKVFSYRAGVMLEPFNDNLKLSRGFDRKEILEQVKETLKEQNFTVDEGSVSFEIKENELYVEGLASDVSERKSIGFMSGK